MTQTKWREPPRSKRSCTTTRRPTVRIGSLSKPSWTSRAFAGTKVNAHVPRTCSCRFPALREDPQAALDVVYQEFVLRRGLGEQPQPEEFIRRFPALSDLLIRQFAVDDAMRSAATTTERSGDRNLGQAADETDVSTVADEDSPDGEVSFPTFPRYELIGVIGRGGMGVVYKALDTLLGRVVALKTITELELEMPNQSGRFLDEARSAARLQHPNIITVHEIGEYQGRPYFVQEFVDGGDLKKQLARQADGRPASG